MPDTRPRPPHPPDLESRVRALDPWFHDIDLGGGVRTKVARCADEPLDHPRSTWELVRPHLPVDLARKSVLDVGCNAGFYSLEVKRLGAARVLGVDVQRREIAQARLAAEVLGLDVSFERRSVYDLSIAQLGGFDLVLALGLLYHCRHPLLALDRLSEVTRGTLVVESAVAPPGWPRPPRGYSIGGLTPRIASAYFFENEADSKEAVYNWFLPTTECLVSLLRSAGFTRIRDASTLESRALLVAERSVDPPADGGLPSFRARIAGSAPAASASPSGEVSLSVSAWNTGTAPWPPSVGRETEHGAVLLGVHLLDLRGNVLEWDYRRYRFPIDRPVLAGQRIDFPLVLRVPGSPGRYVLQFDLVREFEAWFEDLGGEALDVALEVGRSA